jgi:hypothetical protein
LRASSGSSDGGELAGIAAAAVDRYVQRRAKALSLEIESEGAPVVSGDQDACNNVLSLLTNATVHAGLRASLSRSAPDAMARLTVKDDGVGWSRSSCR